MIARAQVDIEALAHRQRQYLAEQLERSVRPRRRWSPSLRSQPPRLSLISGCFHRYQWSFRCGRHQPCSWRCSTFHHPWRCRRNRLPPSTRHACRRSDNSSTKKCISLMACGSATQRTLLRTCTQLISARTASSRRDVLPGRQRVRAVSLLPGAYIAAKLISFFLSMFQ